MTESSYDSSPLPGEKIRVAKDKWKPRIKEAEETLVPSGLNPKSKEYVQTKKNIARKLQEKEESGDIDSRTGILNLSGFRKRGKIALERAKRLSLPIAYILLDVNNLKWANDNVGYNEGDRLIKAAADGLMEGTRESDLVARIGGDEFAVILENGSYEGTEVWWTKVNRRFTSRGLSIGAGVIVVNPAEEDWDIDWGKKLDEYKDLAHRPLNVAKSMSKLGGEGNYMRRYDEVSSHIQPETKE